MNDWHYFFNHVDDNLADSTYRIFEEEYKTEIFDWFSREDVGKEQKEDFIQALVDFPDDCGDFYRYRAYLLAAEALNYFKDCSRGDAIASQILKWSYAYFRQDRQDLQIVPQPLVEAARLAVETTDRQRVIAAFVHLVHTTPSQHILHIAAEKLGKLAPGNKSAIAALVLLLQIPQDESTVWQITYSLMQIDPDNPAIISTLVKLTQTNTDGLSNLDRRRHTIEYAIEALEEIGRGNETAINALVRLMQTTVDKSICLHAVIGLGEIALNDQTAIAALTDFLRINQGDRICLDAVKALWQIDEGNADAIATLVQTIATTTDGFLLHQAATYLVQFQPKNVDAISALIERIETTQDEYIRLQAAASLVKFDAGNELAIATLSRILQSSDYIGYRQLAADSLLSIDSHNQVAIDSLFALIKYLGQSPPDPEYVKSIAYDATRSLQKIDFSNQLAIAAILNLLNTAENDCNLNIAVEDLGDFAAGSKDAIAALTKLLASTEDNYLLVRAAYNLGRIDPGNQKALFTLIEFIQTFDEWDNTEIYKAENGRSRYLSQLLNRAKNLRKILPINQMPQVVVALKDYLSKSKRDSSYRYEACYNLIWHCAQNMPYPDFYKAWHKS